MNKPKCSSKKGTELTMATPEAGTLITTLAETYQSQETWLSITAATRSTLIISLKRSRLSQELVNHLHGAVREQEKGVDLERWSHIRRMLKAPPVNPRTYISWYYNIDLTEGR